MKIYDFNILGERMKEVKTLQVNFWKDADGNNLHINMDASGITEDVKQLTIRALKANHTVFFVNPGGLERNETPKPSAVCLTVCGTKAIPRRKAV